MGKIITTPLPHDLPENWTDNQYVSPGGTEVGLSEKHGFNYLMKQVNNAQKAIEELDNGALPSGGRFQIGSSSPANLSDIGWYRVAKIEGTTNGNANALLFLGHNYGNGGPSSMIVSINFNLYAPSIVVLDYKSAATPFFDKIRIVSDSASKKSYLEVHYNRALVNVVMAGAIFFTYDELAVCSSQNFTSVDDTPSEGTVILSQSIQVTKNGTVLTTGDSPVVTATLE